MSIDKNTYTGLTDSQVIESCKIHGSNVISEAKKKSVWIEFLGKFKDPLIMILVVAGVFSLGISCYEYFSLDQGLTVFFEPSGIFIAVLLATGLGFIFEHQAEKEFEILNKVNDDEPVQVIRNNGNVTTVPRREIVVGDIVLLNTGDEVPADGRLLDAVNITVDESTLTGEPSCAKTTDETLYDAEATFPSNMVMKGTKVLEGHGVVEITAVGDSTENGKVFQSVQIDNSVKTPLNEQLDRLGRMITRISYTIAGLIIVGRVLSYFLTVDFDWMGFIAYFLQSIMIAVALIAVAIPEGLPMAVTLSLAYSMKRMLKTNNLVRKMHACETMGAVTVICTDKTGTLTQNQMRVKDAVFFGLDENDPLIYDCIAVNSTAQLDFTDATHPVALGNPTEGALLLWLNERGVDYKVLRNSAHVVEELPFTTENKYMVTVVKTDDGRRVVFVKGAPEIVISLCDKFPDGLTSEDIKNLLLGYQNKAMRTLAFACAELADSAPSPIFDGHLVSSIGLRLMGVVAIADPVRAEVPAAIRECMNAGIRVTIITGDTVATARQIAREIGLWTDADTDEAITTGPDIDAMSDDELKRRAQHIKIIARARPMDKKRFVEALESLGDVVAATGDGTNDAPALKAAQVGLSMGDGTSVAKGASDITIVDNSFASIGHAVMWGRSLYKNIQRFVLFQMTVNVVACLVVLFGAFLDVQSPLTVTQMLWVNLIMDTFAAMALASLPPEQTIMNDRPRQRNAFIISRSMWSFIFGVGLMFFAILLVIMLFLEHHHIDPNVTAENLKMNTMTTYEQSLFFTIFVFIQFWNLFNAKAFGSNKSAFNMKGCRGFVVIMLIIFVGQIIIVNIGGQFFNVTPLRLNDWLLIISSTSLVAIVGEAIRTTKRRLTK